jgi:hypothetical protein
MVDPTTTLIGSSTAVSLAVAAVLFLKNQSLVTARWSMIVAAILVGIGATFVAAAAGHQFSSGAISWEDIALQAVTSAAAGMGAMAPFPKPRAPTPPPQPNPYGVLRIPTDLNASATLTSPPAVPVPPDADTVPAGRVGSQEPQG